MEHDDIDVGVVDGLDFAEVAIGEDEASTTLSAHLELSTVGS